ncbi:hypothetical protein HB815_16295 [Listeria booriae]|uniref:toxin Cry1Ac domain D-VI-related protein n=1 Tax=Listeria booriae TaxID=1552123 RepID=UPI0016244C9C|nr:toxin Cry1Ac domain D-VI-related protein [Listeria booriae]MBC1212487.1 hypothetical protein [Listeria booriae]
MNRKKIVSMLTVSTLVGSTLASPITVMAQEQPAQQTVSKANKTTKSVPVNVRSIENPELFKVSSAFSSDHSYYQFDVFDAGDMNHFNISRTYGTTKEIQTATNIIFMALRVDEEKQEFGIGGYKIPGVSKGWPASVDQLVDTEVGKEYTFKANVRMDNNNFSNSKTTLVYAGPVTNSGFFDYKTAYAESNKINTISFTFKATSKSTRIRIQRDFADYKVEDFTMFSGASLKKSDKQVEIDSPNQKVAREAVNNLFENKNPLGNIVTGLIQQDITNAQNLVNQVEGEAQKAALQKDLDEAQKQLDARTAEKARQEAAETSVKELFNNNDVTGSIKDSTNQAAIDNAKQKVDAVTDSTKKAELQKNLDEAQRQFDVNYEYRLKGLGDFTFATIDISMQKMWADINIKAGAPHVYFADTYASIVIQDKAGNEKYAKTFIGVDTNQASTVRVPLAIGDEITTYHREATSGSTDRLEIQNEKTKAYLEAATTITYVVTSQGLVVKTEVQAQDKAREAVNNLFENKDPKGKIMDSLTQAEIDAAQGLVDQVKDTTQKAELQKDLDEAQKQLDARNVAAAEKARQEAAETSVKELFNNNDVAGSIKDSTNQAAIDNAQQKVDAVTDSTKKAELQKNLDEAQRQFDVNYEYRLKGLGDFTFATIDISMQKMWADIDIKAGAPHVYFANNYATILIQDKAGNIKYVKFFVGTDINQASTVRVPLAIGDEITTYHREATSGSTDRLEIQNEKTKAYLEAATSITYVVTSQGLVAKKEVQAQDKAREAVNNLFENKDPKGKITDSLIQAEIDVAQGLVDQVKDTTQKAELQKDLDEAQKQLTAKKEAEEKTRQAAAEAALKALFYGNDVNGTIKDTTNQAAIDNVQGLIDVVTDPIIKAALQKDLDHAQALLDARIAAELDAADKGQQLIATFLVNQLFQNNDPLTDEIKNITNQLAIDTAQEQIDLVKVDTVREALQKTLDRAQELLDARDREATEKAAEKAVNELFQDDKPTTGAIKDTTNQDTIDAAQQLVDKVTDPTIKAALQKDLDKAQELLDAKLAAEKAAKAAVNDLFIGNNPANNIKDTTTQAAIDAAQAKVNAVTDPAVKAELQAQVDKAQAQINTRNPINGTVAKYTAGDLNITGTYSGPATALSVDINGKRYYGGTIANGTFKFYVGDKNLKPSDVVTLNFYDANKQIQKSITVTVFEALKITIADYKIGDNYLTATYNYPEITKIGIVVDGTKYWGGDVKDGNAKFFAADKIKNANADVTMNFYDASNNLIASKKVVIATASAEISTANYTVGATNITGTFAGDIRSLAVSINGTKYYGGSLTTNGTYKFYVLDKKIKATDTVIVYGYDANNGLLSEKTVTIVE